MENTSEPLQITIEHSTDWIEFDVRENADERFIIYHDCKTLHLFE